MTIIKKLTARRFYNVSTEDLEEWEQASGDEESDEFVDVFVGHIDGIAVCREILEASVEELHPIVATTEDPSINPNADEYAKYNYGLEFEPMTYEHIDCSHCYGELQELNSPLWLVVGLPVDAKDAVELRTRKGKLKRLRKIRAYLNASIQAMESYDAIYYPDGLKPPAASDSAANDSEDDAVAP